MVDRWLPGEIEEWSGMKEVCGGFFGRRFDIYIQS